MIGSYGLAARLPRFENSGDTLARNSSSTATTCHLHSHFPTTNKPSHLPRSDCQRLRLQYRNHGWCYRSRCRCKSESKPSNESHSNQQPNGRDEQSQDMDRKITEANDVLVVGSNFHYRLCRLPEETGKAANTWSVNSDSILRTYENEGEAEGSRPE